MREYQHTMDADQLLSLYCTLRRVQRCKEQLVKSYAGLIHGACHTYASQEAIAAGICAHYVPVTLSLARTATMAMFG